MKDGVMPSLAYQKKKKKKLLRQLSKYPHGQIAFTILNKYARNDGIAVITCFIKAFRPDLVHGDQVMVPQLHWLLIPRVLMKNLTTNALA